MDIVPPDERVWISYSRERAFPISTVASVSLHLGFLALVLLGVLSLFERRPPEAVDFEPVVLVEAPGGGARGMDAAARAGIPSGTHEDVNAVESHSSSTPSVAAQPDVTVHHEPPPMALLQPGETDASARINQRIANLPPVQSLKPLLSGLPDGKAKTGAAGFGSGQGSGSGPGVGEGFGSRGRLTHKQARQLRWTLLFNIRGAADYLDQLDRMKAIIGVQFPDKSIKLITNLKQRPARLEPGDRVPDRIFWMDDSPDAVMSMAKELGIQPRPWRVIAFFPASLEEELARKEKAYGKRFGRQSEDEIAETVFRVDERYGLIEISVTRQTSKP